MLGALYKTAPEKVDSSLQIGIATISDILSDLKNKLSAPTKIEEVLKTPLSKSSEVTFSVDEFGKKKVYSIRLKLAPGNVISLLVGGIGDKYTQLTLIKNGKIEEIISQENGKIEHEKFV